MMHMTSCSLAWC